MRTSCPEPATLSQMLVGQLPDEEAIAVGAHLEQCPNCLAVMRGLESNDSAVRAVKERLDVGGQTPPDDLAKRLIGRLLMIHADTERVGETPSPDGALEANAPGQVFGDYELQDELGTGGMGVVYKARQRSLGRVVALKMIRAGEFADQNEIRRFHDEAEAVARLDHPGIVPVFEIGQHGRQHFFSMGYIDGGTLADRLDAGRILPREAAELLREVALAVDYAHRQGVVHRDLKPSNILLDSAGRPRVADFGLAKRLDSDRGLTVSGQKMGTPQYMSPEQVRGDRKQLDSRTDIYSLGAVLYHLLAGQPPFTGTAELVLLQTLNDEPTNLRVRNQKIPRDLETICVKCLEKAPERRYATAREMADDLERFLNGRPIHARPVGAAEQLARSCRRNPAVAGLAAALMLSLVGLLIAMNVKDRSRFPDPVASPEPERKLTRRIHFLGVGVTNFEQNAINDELERKGAFGNLEKLRFADNDVRKVAFFLEKSLADPQSPSAKGSIVTLTAESEIPPTEANISSKFHDLSRVAGANDLAIVMFAGHGLGVEGQPFKFLAQDSKSVVAEGGINEQKIQSLVNLLPCRTLLLMDCCHFSFTQPAQSPQNQPVILSACRSNESSLEYSRFRHGLFTAAILEALSGQRAQISKGADPPELPSWDEDDDGWLSVGELCHYVTVRTPQLCEEIAGRKFRPQILKSETFLDADVIQLVQVPQKDSSIRTCTSLDDAAQFLADQAARFLLSEGMGTLSAEAFVGEPEMAGSLILGNSIMEKLPQQFRASSVAGDFVLSGKLSLKKRDRIIISATIGVRDSEEPSRYALSRCAVKDEKSIRTLVGSNFATITDRIEETSHYNSPDVAMVDRGDATTPELNDVMQQMAAEVVKLLEQEGATSIQVGPFTGPPTTSGGPGIVQGIKDNLPKEIDTAPNPNGLLLSGKYRLTKDKKSGKHCIVIEASICDSIGESLQDVTRYILTDELSVQTLMGGNGPLPTKASPGQSLAEARDEALVKNITKPAVSIEPSTPGGPNSIVRVPGSPFGVEIMAFDAQGSSYVPLPVIEQGGLPFVEFQREQIFAVRLINDGVEPAGAAVAIDGINSLAFSRVPGFKEVGKWVVGPKNPKALVKGWHRLGNQFSAFRVTDYGDSVAGRAGIVGPAIGTISVQFFAAFADAPPPDEPRGDLIQRGELMIGEGPVVDKISKPVHMKFGVSRGQISIRYTRDHADELPNEQPPPQ